MTASKEQINVIVKKTAKRKPTWFVTVVHHDGTPGYLTVVLPGEFTMARANVIGLTLALTYRAEGYTVAYKRAVRGRG